MVLAGPGPSGGTTPTLLDRMDAFSDLVVTFGSSAPPGPTRLGAGWRSATSGPGGVWTSAGARAESGAIATRSRGSWTTWAVGDVIAYRGSTDDPLGRFTSDVAAGRAEPGQLDAHA